MLKGIINKAHVSVLAGLLAALSPIAVALAVPSVALAEDFYSVRDLLSEQFKGSERVTFVRVQPTAEQTSRLAAQLGHARALPRREYTFYVATSAGKVDGYALFDEEPGQHQPISFATFFDAKGQVTRVEIVTYREPYGDGVRSPRFREQFVGRNAKSGFAPDHDIDAISGATISSRALCVGVKRAALLLDELVVKAASMLAKR
jgi:Na+-translocating ferredoxin:NAD+ oxidoreductase RnfG subunit